MREENLRRTATWLVLLCAVVISAGFLRFRPRLMELGMSRHYATHRFLLELIPLLAVAVWLGLPRRRDSAPAVLGGILALALMQRGFEAGEVYPTIPARAFYPPLDLLRSIPKGAPERVSAIGFSLVPNSSTLYELEDVRGYEALVLARFVETYPLWCVEQPVWFNRVDDPQRPFLSFHGIVERGAERARDSDSWTPNGEGAARILQYTGQNLRIQIDARSPTVVATSIPAWPGWRVTLDDRPIAIEAYNRAFLSFRVPSGHHQARLWYWPKGFSDGLWITGITAIASLVLLFRGPTARSRQNMSRLG